MQGRHVRALDIPELAFAQRRDDVVVDDAPVRLRAGGLAADRDMHAHVTLGQHRHRRFPRRRLRIRVSPLLDAIDGHRRLPARFGHGHAPVPGDAAPLAAPRPARLHHEDLAPAHKDAYPESGQVAIPDQVVLLPASERVHAAFGQPPLTGFGHGVLRSREAVARELRRVVSKPYEMNIKVPRT